MHKSIPLHRNNSDKRSHPWPSSGQKFTVHYLADGKVLCQAEHRLSADTRFIELPLPVLHRTMMGMTK